MRALVQRVSQGSVAVEGQVVGQIGLGLLVLLGVAPEDQQADIDWLCRKLCQLRIFPDEAGLMNRSVLDCQGEVLAVSQFTLFASVKKGNRPAFTRAAPPEQARLLFDCFVSSLQVWLGRPVPCGVFGADMQVALVNDGPVTLWLDSKAPE